MLIHAGSDPKRLYRGLELRGLSLQRLPPGAIGDSSTAIEGRRMEQSLVVVTVEALACSLRVAKR